MDAVASLGAAAADLRALLKLWLAELLGIALLVSLVFLRMTWGKFFRLSGDFAEEL